MALSGAVVRTMRLHALSSGAGVATIAVLVSAVVLQQEGGTLGAVHAAGWEVGTGGQEHEMGQ